jgi:hypothetical protein
MPDDETTDEDMVPRSHIRDLEAKAKRADALERDLAFAQALGPTTDPKLDYFRRGYEGDLTAEAIRRAAETAGFLTQPTTAPLQQTVDVVPPPTDAQDRIASASVGAGNPAPADFYAELSKCRNVDDVMELCGRTRYPPGHEWAGRLMVTERNEQ